MLVFVLLELIVVFVFLEEQSCFQLVAALNTVNVLIHAALETGRVRVHDVKLLEEIEIAHVHHCAVHLTEADISHFAK